MTVSRNEAVERGLKFYHGGACKNCGGTKRRVNGRSCLNCSRARKKAADEVRPPSPFEIAREEARARGDTFYEGKPCPNGHTTRRVDRNNCAVCQGERFKRMQAKSKVLATEREARAKERKKALALLRRVDYRRGIILPA